MPCPSLRLVLSQAWPNSLVRDSKLASHSSSLSADASSEAYRRAPSASAARGARDCRRRDGRAAVMQVRPLAVSSGTAGSSPFGRSAFGPLGWL